VTINVFSFKPKKRGGRWAVEKAGPWKARKPKAGFPRFPPPLEIPQKPRDSHFSHSPDCWLSLKQRREI
jgi:hypothetical protein